MEFQKVSKVVMSNSKMTKWLNVIASIRDGNYDVICPVCRAQSVQYKETLLDESGLGYADVWCEECRNAFHVSRGTFQKPIATTDIVPKGLKY